MKKVDVKKKKKKKRSNIGSCPQVPVNLTLGYMTKTLNQIIFFPPPKSKYFFQQHWESEYFFRKKPYIYICINKYMLFGWGTIYPFVGFKSS
jgi:hypothetical protein